MLVYNTEKHCAVGPDIVRLYHRYQVTNQTSVFTKELDKVRKLSYMMMLGPSFKRHQNLSLNFD